MPRSIRLAALSAAVTALLVGAVSANAASVIGPGGQVSACYVKKGKKGKKGKNGRKGKKGQAKGTLRVVPPGKRCKKGERPLTLSAQGQPGQTGATGQTGAQGGSGQTSSTLETRVTQLESVLSGVTNTDLLSTITNATKLNGISASDLTGAIASVNALCTEMTTAVDQLNSLRTVLAGLSLTAPLLALGDLVVPSIPAALPTFACP
ncbi:MAG: hypothetical protein WBV53_15990 [Solirubrobacterales bacterium]